MEIVKVTNFLFLVRRNALILTEHNNLFLFLNQEQIAVQGRAKIEEKKQAEIVLINIKKNEALAKLDIQYKTADRAKKTFGFIGIFFYAASHCDSFKRFG